MAINIDFVHKKSQELTALSDRNILFEQLMKINEQTLIKLENQWSPKDTVQPVVLLRYLIVQELLKKHVINSDVLNDIKAAIEARSISKYYNTSQAYQKNLDSYKNSDKGMFPQWKEPFSILYPFFYSQEDKKETLDILESLGNEIINKYDLENARVHCVGFDGSQNYGSPDAWGAVIPNNAGNVQKAHQIFFKINDKGVTGGLYSGHQIDALTIKNDGKQFSTWKEYLDFASTFVSEWKEKNNIIDFEYQNDEIEFVKRIKKSEKDDLNIFFSAIDEIIRRLALENNGKLVFSCASGQLSFHVGKRYCLCLKVNKFSFITSKNYVIQNAEVSGFSEPDDALYYKNIQGASVALHLEEIVRAVQSEIKRDNHTEDKSYDNKAFRKAVFDHSYSNQLFPDLSSLNNMTQMNDLPKKIKENLNQILFGPPGTGKTYHTLNEAVRIIDPEYYENNKSDRDALKSFYTDKLIVDWEIAKGQIGFCTFHQSFSYEDFVEGIKPVEPTDGDTYLKYKVEEGIFKRMCRLAGDGLRSADIQHKHLISLSDDQYKKATFYKLSLGDINDPTDQEIYDYCMDKGLIALGFGEGIDFSGMNESQVSSKYNETFKDGFGSQAVNYFKNYLTTGNYVIISKGNHYIRAIGKVTGEYFFDLSSPIRYNHFRKVEWVFKDQEIPIQDIYERNLSQQSIYKLNSALIKKAFFVKAEAVQVKELKKSPPKYILVIDEINRGNVASIFGELITLIEPDKRAGNKEAVEVVLPYSKERFTVPSNLYIIGTMNTADRSIEALDTALRRRFSFKEMAPDPTLIRTGGSLKESKGMIDDIDVVKLLSTINDRIEKLIDKDHKIGHAYFMDLENIDDLKLAFKDKVIPLLEEYFFGDYGKIGLVLGDSFIAQKSSDDFHFALFSAYDSQMAQDLATRSIYSVKAKEHWDFKSVYTK